MSRVFLLFILACGSALAADTVPPSTSAPATSPTTSTATTLPATNPANREWKINSYLHGTPAQIREQLNAELERLIRLRVTRQEAVKNATESVKAAVGKGASLRDARIALKEAQNALKETESAVARAYLWRRRLVEAVRAKFTMRWPLRPGVSGLLGLVTPLRIEDAASSMRIRFLALESIRNEDRSEGITREKVLVHDVGMMVTGIKIDGMNVGTPIALDQNFIVVWRDSERRSRPSYTVMRKADDLDALMNAVNDLRESIDAKELSRMVRESVPKKSNAKTWVSIDRILSTTQPVRDPDIDAPDFKRVSSWLERELPGDRVALRANVLKVLPREDGSYNLHAAVDADEARHHFLIGTLLPSAVERGRKLEGEQQQRIKGTILDAHLSEENTLIIELIDVDFGG